LPSFDEQSFSKHILAVAVKFFALQETLKFEQIVFSVRSAAIKPLNKHFFS